LGALGKENQKNKNSLPRAAWPSSRQRTPANEIKKRTSLPRARAGALGKENKKKEKLFAESRLI
jgi:hypothetical protein